MSGDNLHLPPEICSLILTKLPVKSILRFRCVCKTWYSLISCPDFVSAFGTLSQSTRSRTLVHRLDPKNGLLDQFSSHDESFVESHEHNELSEQLQSPGFRIVGYCNGLVCLTNYLGYTVRREAQSFLIWNPSIRKLIELPLRSPSSSTCIGCLLGFGFDLDNGGYKVLRVGFDKSYGPSGPMASVIFDLRKGAWRSLNVTMRPCLDSVVSCGCVYLNENLHWMGNWYPSGCILLTFNLSGEVFGEIEMPCDVKINGRDDYDEWTLFSVALLSRPRFCHPTGTARCSVWSMKEYGVTESWTKLFCIEELPYIQDWFSSLVGVWESGEVLMRLTDYKSLVSYNPKSKESKVLLANDTFIQDVLSYKESLVLL